MSETVIGNKKWMDKAIENWRSGALKNVASIDSLIFLLEGKEDLVVAELGVLYGGSTWKLLVNCDIKKYYAIDLWESYDEGLDDMWNISKSFKKWGSEQLYITVKKMFEEFPQVNIIKESTHKAHRHIKDGELDFCFIDANHNWYYVYKDIKLWLPKIKKGGILSGDDYGIPSVREAVKDFFYNKNYKINIKGNSWWIINEN